MKKLIYGTAAKALAVLLFISCIVSGTLVVTDGILRIDRDESLIYNFENSFSESVHLHSLLEAPMFAVMDAYYDAYGSEHHSNATESSEPVTSEAETEAPPPRSVSEAPPDVAVYLEKELNGLYCGDRVNYFVEWNGQIFTNCNAATAEQALNNTSFSYLVRRDEKGGITTNASTRYTDALDVLDFISRYDTASTVTVAVSIKESYAAECRALWDSQAAIVTRTIAIGGLLALGALLQLIYLVCVCGRNKDGEQRILWVDYIWSEIHLALAAGAVTWGVLLYILVLEEGLYAYFPAQLLYPLAGGLAALASAILLTSLLSIIRNIKARRGVDASLILSVIRLLWRGLVRICRWIGRTCRAGGRGLAGLLSRKSGRLALAMLIGYTLVLLSGVFTFAFIFFDTGFLILWVAALILAFALACSTVIKHSADLDIIHKGVVEMQNGNVSHRIPPPKSEELKPLADSINNVAEGLDRAVADKVKAERMKAELITNVSHDLKTPLTSIINYTELLAQVEDLPEEARDYVAILAKKNLRLKHLTQDLFDISKAQSGNEEILPERLDVALLMEQILGEQDGEIQASRLSFCVSTPKELYILADGRKMSRAVSNLLNNILKYAMENTRVFITAAEAEGRITLEFKNVSASPLDFDPEEIVGRFVRGDESRTTEGSGLGLAIAKSYAELCGGTLEIRLDGDLFKAILSFPAYPAAE